MTVTIRCFVALKVFLIKLEVFMIKGIKFVLATSVIFLGITSAIAGNLAGASGTLQNIDSAINASVKSAERLFEENHGKRMNSAFSTISTDNKNPYLSKLNIKKDYKVLIKLADSARNSPYGETPVAKSLLGVEILLIPVYYKGDEKINSWECLTNADMGIQKFIGDVGTKEYTASFIRDYTDNTYLSLCIYIKKKKL